MKYFLNWRYSCRFLFAFALTMTAFAGMLRAQAPSASFTSNVFMGCAPLSVDFTNLSTQATNYYWDFGNGNTSTLTDPTTVYTVSGQYTVTLIAINGITGDRDTLIATNYITVVDDPVPNFTATPLTGCAGYNVIDFTNLSTNAISYIWDFGDGSFSTAVNPQHTYLNPGTYTVKLIASNAFSCNKIKIEPAYITIFPNPPAEFIVNQQSSCDVNQVFNFTCTTPGAIAWQWNFGDGSTSTLPAPSHVYGAQGTYSVTLIVTNPSGCTDTLVEPGYISIGPSLVPSFTVNAPAGCPPFNAVFTSTNPNATSWLWDFGDGNTSTLENPSNTYNSSGIYDITLTVTTTSGCNGSVTIPAFITVDAIPVPSFTNNPATGCDPLNVTFTNTSANAATYYWDFGDSTNSTSPDPVHLYSTAGTYNVTLVATSANGCQDSITQNAAVTVNTLNAVINGTPRVGCAPLTIVVNGTSNPVTAVTWLWDFGDGTTGSGQSLNHTYTVNGNYTVTLIATSAAGCTDTIVRPAFFRVVDAITPYTVPDTMNVCTPSGTVSFTDPTYGSNLWLWNFGDGSTSTVKNPTHSYLVPGVYTVTLTAGMAGGCSQTFNPFAIINVVEFIPSPITSLLISPCRPYTVELNNATPGVSGYLWDFGDGTTSTLQNPVHVYAQPGTYTVSLTLTATNGCQSALSTTVTFGHSNPITVSATAACLSSIINFGLNPIGDFASAIWNFGDGTTSNQLEPSHVYSSPGTYNVSVITTDTDGCVDTFNLASPIIISNPVAGFVVNQPTFGCTPFDVQFTNTSSGGTGYQWQFGDSAFATDTNPSHTYTNSGIYTVTLIVTAPGCSDTLIMPDLITAHTPQVNFTFTPDTGCIPMTVTYTDLSVNAVSWLWQFGDGNTSNIQNPVHTFTAAPTSNVRLTITDNTGCTKTRQKPNIVAIEPEITADTTNGCRPLTVTFSTTTVATSYLWDFGDGTTSTLQNPVKTYTQTGLYPVSLTCVLPVGCTTSTLFDDSISVTAPVSGFMSPTVAVCAPSLVNFVNQSTGAVAWLWDFGDGTTSTAQNPSHIYNIPGTYTISLISYSNNGCTDTLVKVDYIVVPGTLSSFTLASMPTCQDKEAQFIDQSVNASNWFWNFGDGTTSTLQNPTHVYTDTGSYTVTLITSDSIGCSSFYVYPIALVVHPTPDASASLTPSTGCAPLNVTFTDSSTNASVYSWYFGDGDSSSLANPVHTYSSPGSYNVVFVASNQFGCVDSFTFASPVIVNETPIAEFGQSALSGCLPLTVNFNDLSTNLNSPAHSWDFGNGQTSTSPNPSVTYNIAGIYNITLIVTNAGGCTDTIIHTVTINPAPVASATVTDTLGCAPWPVSFQNTSTGATSYLWNFGDGDTSTLTDPLHTYTTPGLYTITLIAINPDGCSDTLQLSTTVNVVTSPVAAFTRTPASGCAPLNVSFTNTSSQLNNPVYNWSFGNGQVSNLANPTTVYNIPGMQQVTLIVTNDGGCSDTARRNVNVLSVPVASASVDDTSGCLPFTVSFTNNTTGNPSFLWNFGDGDTSTAQSPSHTYLTAGNYNVTLIAINSNGCADTFNFPFPLVANESPVAGFTRTPTSGCAPVTVSFTNTSSQLNNPSYLWNFGNGQTATTQNAVMTYTATGLYPVNLVVTNANGCVDSISRNVNVFDTPVASASINTSSGCSPLNVTFTNNSTNATSYTWSFGDGTTSTQTNPSHTYSTPGTYQVSLIATGAGGCSDTVLVNPLITVYETPSAQFTTSNLSGCTPVNVSFNNISTGLDNPVYQWDFGNGLTSAISNPSVNYDTAGTYVVSLIVTNQGGCSDTASVTINVYNSLVANAGMSDTAGCSPFSINFTDLSLFGTAWQWDFGDGNTSTQQNPTHIYNNAGVYNVSLIVTGQGTCSDTFYFSSPVYVNPSPNASFTSSTISGCTPLQVTFNNTSTGLSNPSYNWSFGNGNTSTLQNPSTTYNQDGIFIVTLVVTNTEGCNDTAAAAITSELTPVANALPIDTVSCSELTVTFNSVSVNASSQLWVFGDGSTSTQNPVQHTYSNPGYYYPYLVVSSISCSDTFYFPNPVHIKSSPLAAFNATTTSGCSGNTFQLNNNSIPATGLSSQWLIGNNTYNTSNPVVQLNAPGFYDVTLIVTNQEGCTDTLTQANYLQVYDTLPPPISPILSVSVVNNTSVEIIWQNSSTLDLGAYVLYRLNTMTGVYDEIYRDTTPNNSSMSVVSSYTDIGLNTLLRVYTYKLATLDLCTNVLPLSALTPHTTINVTATPVGNNNIRVNWTAYQGCPVGTYEINRVDLGTGTSSLIATVPATILTYLDTGFYCPEEYSYRITATDLCGTAYISLSDTSIAAPGNPLNSQKVEMVRSTVINDLEVLTEWLPPVIAPGRVVSYELYRSTDQVNYDFIVSLPPTQFSYIDNQVDVHEQNYYYRIEIINDCQTAGPPARISSSILLKSEWYQEKTNLWWTEYKEWDNGVDFYIIERQNPNGQWNVVKTVPGNTINTILDE